MGLKPAKEDAVITKVLRYHGAVPYVKTNIPQTMLRFVDKICDQLNMDSKTTKIWRGIHAVATADCEQHTSLMRELCGVLGMSLDKMVAICQLAHGQPSAMEGLINTLLDVRTLSTEGNIMMPQIPSLVKNLDDDTMRKLQVFVRVMGSSSVEACDSDFQVLAELPEQM